MNYKMMGQFVAKIVAVEAAFMVPPLLISLFCGESAALRGFLMALGVIAVVEALLIAFCRKSERGFDEKEGLVSVGIGWIALSLLGCLPFYFSGAIPNYVDAFFEIVSGFTTTGSSILPDVECLPKGIMYWRSFSPWMGGFTMHILRAESPGPSVGKLVPRMKKTAGILYLIYVVLTVINVVFLLFGGMPLFDAVCTAFGTAGTGGFGIRNDSLASYSPYLQNVTTIFMFLFGVNFGCYYLLLLKDFRSVLRDEELRLYVCLALGSAAAIAVNIRSMYDTWEEAIRHAAFQVSTIMTTTGFATTDFDLWPSFSKSILLLLMIVGACAGSTGGGLKCIRVLLLLKSLKRNIRQVIRPRKVQVVRNNGQVVDEKILDNTNAYLAAYVVILIVSILISSLDKFSVTTNITAVLACFNNIGPGLEAVGPTCNFSSFSTLSKLVLSFDMLAGRLEIFPILALFSRSTWKHR